VLGGGKPADGAIGAGGDKLLSRLEPARREDGVLLRVHLGLVEHLQSWQRADPCLDASVDDDEEVGHGIVMEGLNGRIVQCRGQRLLSDELRACIQPQRPVVGNQQLLPCG
jgi:hypothetical protein